MNTQAIPLSRDKIRELTRVVRDVCNMGEKTYFPIVEFVERCMPEIDSDFKLWIVPVSEMRDCYGLTNTARHEMRIREDVYEAASAGSPRDRFTLCHELGHYLLHQPEFISMARGEVPKYCDPEWQANTFAGELMAPYELVKGMAVEEIAVKCGMSDQAARIQYKVCNAA